MSWRWKSLLVYSIFSGLLLTSCERADLAMPERPGSAAPTVSRDGVPNRYIFVETTLLPGLPRTVELIGAAGGVVELLGHSLTVPPGAVAQPTLFSIAALPRGRIEVELLALSIDLFGRSHDVGSGGFHNGKTVRLTLSYARATNVSDPSRLVVLHVSDDGAVDPLPTVVDGDARTVTVELAHFSRYCMAID
jgi:hypothetical protein